MSKHLEHIRHDYLRYANCWEDADVLLKGLSIEPSDKVFSIGSAGDNTFSLLSKGPAYVLAVDVNSVQIHLMQLKKASFEAFEYEEFLQFLGFHECNSRLQLFNKVRLYLPNESRQYWDENLQQIEIGVIHTGKFERYFKKFRESVLPLIHKKEKIQELIKDKDSLSQLSFYSEQWDSFRWRLLFRLFFSKTVVGKYGRDPEFLKEVQVPVSKFILNNTKKHLCSVACQKNYFLHYILTGEFGSEMPHYARRENYHSIKANMHALEIKQGYAHEVLNESNGFNKFNLSNIFEYLDKNQFAETCAMLNAFSLPSSKFLYWNLMVPRNISTCVEIFRCDTTSSSVLTDSDLGFFYSGVYVNIKN